MGSDDFRTYVWEVPSVERLREGKRRLGDGVEEWFDEDGEKRIGMLRFFFIAHLKSTV